jgi:hypothetical protein
VPTAARTQLLLPPSLRLLLQRRCAVQMRRMARCLAAAAALWMAAGVLLFLQAC